MRKILTAKTVPILAANPLRITDMVLRFDPVCSLALFLGFVRSFAKKPAQDDRPAAQISICGLSSTTLLVPTRTRAVRS
jgi:hypothetical protein